MQPGSAFTRPPTAIVPPSFDGAIPAPFEPAFRASTTSTTAAFEAISAHSQDVGPLLAQAALLVATEPLDEATRAQWREAMSCALAGHRT